MQAVLWAVAHCGAAKCLRNLHFTAVHCKAQRLYVGAGLLSTLNRTASCLRRDVVPGSPIPVAAAEQAGVDVVVGPAAPQPHAVVVEGHDVEVPVAPLVRQAVGFLRAIVAKSDAAITMLHCNVAERCYCAGCRS